VLLEFELSARRAAADVQISLAEIERLVAGPAIPIAAPRED
jgi:hypothetical protein